MSDRIKQVLLAALLAGCAAGALAQKSTEMFVPIGQSAGLSGKHTLMARVQSADAANGMLMLADAANMSSVRIGPKTSIWLDRSKLQQPNRKGSMADLRKDQLVEVKYLGNDRAGGLAEWVKVQSQE